MSEDRRPQIIWTFRSPNRDGKKPIRFELFPAKRWSFRYDPVNKKKMFPKPPMVDRKYYWNNMYRIRIDGKFYGRKGYSFTFYTMAQALEIAQMMYRTAEQASEPALSTSNHVPDSQLNIPFEKGISLNS